MPSNGASLIEVIDLGPMSYPLELAVFQNGNVELYSPRADRQIACERRSTWVALAHAILAYDMRCKLREEFGC